MKRYLVLLTFLIFSLTLPFVLEAKPIYDLDVPITVSFEKEVYNSEEEINALIKIKNNEDQPISGVILNIELIEGVGPTESTLKGNLLRSFCSQEKVYLRQFGEKQFNIKLSPLPKGEYFFRATLFSSNYYRIANGWDSFKVEGEENEYLKEVKIVQDSLKIEGGLESTYNWGIQEPGKGFTVTGLIENRGVEKKINLLLKIKGWHYCQDQIFYQTEKEIDLAAGDSTPFSFDLTTPQRPTAYAIEIEVAKDNQTISKGYARIISQGISGRIVNVSLNNYKFKKGEEVKIEAWLVGAASGDRDVEGQLRVYLTDEKDNVFYDQTKNIFLPKEETIDDNFSFKAQRNLENFTLWAVLKDAKGNELSSLKEDYKIENFEKVIPKTKIITAILVILAILAVIIIAIWKLHLYLKKKQ